MRLTHGFLALAAMFLLSETLAPAAERVQNNIPFVGCVSDGQTGPLAVPTGGPKAVRMPVPIAAQLAFYKAENGSGAVGPRGWHCFGLYGSNGAILIVSPEPVSTADLLSVHPRGITGPAIQATSRVGDTSGRFDVAAMIARYFPQRMAFVKNVIAEGIEPAVDFPTGGFANDIQLSRGANFVEYRTPANLKGLGTISRFVPNGNPIRTVVILQGSTPDMLQLSVRLPAGMSNLEAPIIKQTKYDASAE